MINLANEPVRDYSKKKQLYKVRVKLTQKQKGEITPKVDKELKARSKGVCELRKKCRGAEAIQRAHITGRKQIEHKTTVNDLLHCCLDCHKWLDENPAGIRYKRLLEETK